jgi:hypothetical protein
MFCPKCSQEQVSDETRFCSRCGFQLNVVKALLTEDSFPQTSEVQKPDRSLRKRDLTIGAALMFVAAFIVATLTVGLPQNHSARILFLIVAWLLLSLLINIKPLIQYFMRGENNAPDDKNRLTSKPASNLFSQAERPHAALPTAQSIPADFITKSAKTAEMAQPLSVTEPTTTLLNK